jgi:hypothetical protein
VSGYRSRRVLNPATEIIGSTTRQIVDCLNASLAERHEHQRGDSGNVFEFVCNTKLLPLRIETSLYLVRQMSVGVARRGSSFDGIGQASNAFFYIPRRLRRTTERYITAKAASNTPPTIKIKVVTNGQFSSEEA